MHCFSITFTLSWYSFYLLTYQLEFSGFLPVSTKPYADITCEMAGVNADIFMGKLNSSVGVQRCEGKRIYHTINYVSVYVILDHKG